MLLYISAIGMTITLSSLGGYFYAKDVLLRDVTEISWLPLASLMIFVLCFSLGYGPIPWLMMGEILPAKIRGSAASVATGFNWSCTFIVTKSFDSLMGTYGECNFNQKLRRIETCIHLYMLFFFSVFLNSNLCSCLRNLRIILAVRNDLSDWILLCVIQSARNPRQKLGRHRTQNDGTHSPNEFGGQYSTTFV